MKRKEKLKKDIEIEVKALKKIEAECERRIKEKKLKIAGLRYDLNNLKED